MQSNYILREGLITKLRNERQTDFFIGKLLDLSKIKYTPNGSNIKELHETASKIVVEKNMIFSKVDLCPNKSKPHLKTYSKNYFN